LYEYAIIIKEATFGHDHQVVLYSSTQFAIMLLCTDVILFENFVDNGNIRC